MSAENTVRLLELVSSKICHDLISPVGAVSNGVEILEEMGADDDVTALISFSAAQANAKLKTLRLAYGLGGADTGIRLEEIHQTFNEFITGDNRVKQDWDAHLDLGFEPKTGFPKILMCSLLLASEALPKGGTISVSAEDNDTILVTGHGENANFRDGVTNALMLETSANDLAPKLIHPYITGLFAQIYGFDITTDTSQTDSISLRVKQNA